MNLMRTLRARGARRRAVRVTMFALACLVAVAGSTFRPAAQAGNTAVTAAPTQAVTKRRVAKRSAAQTNAQQQQVAKPSRGAQFADASTQATGEIGPLSTSCANKTPISGGQTINGALASGDCVLQLLRDDNSTYSDNSFYDEYTFNGTAGQQVSVALSSTAFDAYVFLLKPGESIPHDNPNLTFQDDDGGGGTNALLNVTLPATGTYSILANVFVGVNGPSTGAYSLTLTLGATNCPPTPTQIANGQTINGSLDSGECRLDSDNTVYDAYSFTANAGQQVSITMTSASFDVFLELLPPGGSIANEEFMATDDNSGGGTNAHIPSSTSTGFGVLPATGTYIILANSARADQLGSYSLTLNIAASNCPSAPISVGQTVNSTLATTDCRLPADGSFLDQYTFSGTQGQQIAITMTATTPAGVDPFLFLLSPAGADIADDDSSGGGTAARIPATGFFTLPSNGTYTIYANTSQPNQTGGYTLSLTTPVSCTYTFQTSVNIPAAGGNFSVGYATQAGCPAPTATSNASWLTNVTVNSTTNTVSYTAAANPGGSRTGTLTIAGQTFTVTQAQSCSYTLVQSSANVPAGSGNFSFGVTSQAGCPLTDTEVVNSVPWITVGTNMPIDANGHGTVNYSVAANIGPARTGTIIVVNQTFTVIQDANCIYSLNSTGRSFTAAGGADSFNVITPTGCPWTATSSATWVTITAGASGNGNGAVNYSVAANPTAIQRTATITVQGLTYTITQAGVACTYSISPTNGSFTSGGGTGSFSVAAPTGCTWTAVSSDSSWLTTTSNGNGDGTVNYSVATNSLSNTRTATITVQGQVYTVTQVGAGCTYSITPTNANYGANGGTGSFNLTTISDCNWTATSSASWLTITSATNGTGNATINYTVAANTGAARTATITVGGQTFTVTNAAGPATLQFSAASYNFSESNVSAIITVTRTGDASGTATVNYMTVDDQSPIPCDPTARDGNGNPFPRGTAFARCDYATTLDTLTFAPNEMSKDFFVPLINDVHVEDNEVVMLRLSNPTGAVLGTQSTATLTITDNDAGTPTTNPVNQTPFFVRLHYLDFLSREPEPGEPWSRVLNNCADPFNTNPNSPSAGCDRLIVSQSFFGSPEFKLKGTFVFLFHKVAFGAASNPNYFPEYVDFATDLRRITGATSEEVVAKRQAYTQEFVTRPAFVNRYSGTSNAQYVDTLLANVGATLTTPDPQSGVTRNSLVGDLNAGTKTRADVLRAIVESQEVNQRQFNFAFVASQYYGYLRRTPDQSGYQAWLNALLRGENSRTMVNGFMNSVEYRLRFGPNVLQ